MSRIVNIRYTCCGYHFDAAIDCDFELHYYGEKRADVIPIELFNLDEPDWDIYLAYQKRRNDQKVFTGAINHTEVEWGLLVKETRKWVRQMRKK